MERLLEGRDAQIAVLNEQLSQISGRNGVLETTVGGLQERVRRLESGLGFKEAEVAALQGKFGSKEEELILLRGENKEKREQIDRLKQSLGELEIQKAKWVNAERAQKEKLEVLLENRSAQFSALNEQVSHFRERNGVLDSTVGGLQEKIRGLETALRTREAELGTLQQKFDGEAEQWCLLREERKARDDQAERLKQAVRELENQKAGWMKKEMAFVSQLENVSAALEDKSCALDSVNAALNLHKEKCLHAEASLKEKIEAMNRYLGDRNGLEDALSACQHELKSLQQEAASETQFLKQKLSVSDFQLNEVVSRLSAKTRELEQVSKALGSKENQLASSVDSSHQLQERVSSLESTIATSKGTIAALESRLKEKELEMVAFNGKLAALEGLLREKEQALERFATEKKGMQGQADGLRQTVLELETKREDWLRKEETLLREMQELSSAFESKCATLDGVMQEAKFAKERCDALGTSYKIMESSLKETIDELDACKAARDNLHDALASCQGELNSARVDRDRRVEEFKNKLEFSQMQLKDALNQLNVKSGEMTLVLKDLETKELQVAAVKDEMQQLRQRNSSLDFTVQSLQVKISKLTEELRTSEAEGQHLCNNLATAEASLALSKELISKLQLKVDLGNQISAKMEVANARIKELEGVLGKIMAFAEENDEKLDVSEWAVKQLGLLEVSKTKSALAQAERDRQEKDFREKLSGYEVQLKESGSQLSANAAEMEQLVKDLENKEWQLASVKEEVVQLREKNSSLDFAVQSLQLKVSKLAEELRRSDVNGQQWYSKLIAVEVELSSSKELISSLQLKVELGNQISAKMEGANAKIKELETVLAELMLFAQDKDEKLDASEWAVQQLGIFEVSKAKANLAQAERERVNLKQRCEDLESELKAKEDELMDMEGCVRQLKDEEAELQGVKRNMTIMVEKHESLKAEHDRVLESIEEYRSQLHLQMEENFNLEQVVEKLKRDVNASQQKASASNSKLKELQSELQATQLNTKSLMQQMLSLHENLIQEGKALVEYGKEDGSPRTASRRSSSSEAGQLDCVMRCAQKQELENSMDVEEAKENVPVVIAAGGKFATPVSTERSPLQILQLAKVNE